MSALLVPYHIIFFHCTHSLQTPTNLYTTLQHVPCHSLPAQQVCTRDRGEHRQECCVSHEAPGRRHRIRSTTAIADLPGPLFLPLLTLSSRPHSKAVADSVAGTGAAASKEANKAEAKSDNATMGQKVGAATDAMGDKMKEVKNDASSEMNKQKAKNS